MVHKVWDEAARRAARIAAEDSMKANGTAVSVHVAWIAVNEKLKKENPFLWNQLASDMPRVFHDEYFRVIDEMRKKKAAGAVA